MWKINSLWQHDYFKIINLDLIGYQHSYISYEVFQTHFCTNVCILKPAILSY